MRKLLLKMFISAILIVSLSSCSIMSNDDEIYWNIGAIPNNIDPALNTTLYGGNIITHTFEGLVREKNGVIYPGTAKSWDISDDGLTITFHLRKSKWSDGSNLNAGDFVYSWLRAMDIEKDSGAAMIWEHTNILYAKEYSNGTASKEDVGIKAVDDYTLEVTLKSPTHYFVSLMSFYHFMPVKQEIVETDRLEKGAWAFSPETAVSNGPFVLEQYNAGEGLRLKKNKYYWNKKDVKISTINVSFIGDSITAYDAYKAGALDVVTGLWIADFPFSLEENSDLYTYSRLGTYYYNFNMDLDIWSDARVRQALSMAIDRELICSVLSSGFIPAQEYLPSGFIDDSGNDFALSSDVYKLSTDASSVEDARALLSDAGYPNGVGFPEFVILYNTGTGHRIIAELIKNMLKINLGIDSVLVNQEWSMFQNSLRTGDFELTKGGWMTDYMDPVGLLDVFTSDNQYNTSGYKNEDFDKLISEANKTTSIKEHYAMLYKAYEIFMDDMPIIPIFYYSESMLVSKKITGWERSALGTMDFSTAKIDDK